MLLKSPNFHFDGHNSNTQTQSHWSTQIRTMRAKCHIWIAFKIFAGALKMKINSIIAQTKSMLYIELAALNHALSRLKLFAQTHSIGKYHKLFFKQASGQIQTNNSNSFQALYTPTNQPTMHVWFHNFNFKLSIGSHYRNPKLYLFYMQFNR